MRRGEIWWAGLGPPAGSEPGHPRPAVIVSANSLNDSAMETVLIVPLTSNDRRALIPGNVRLPTRGTGLSQISIAVVSHVMPVNRLVLSRRMGRVPDRLMTDIDDGLRLVLSL